jgi:hypothetical protein
MTAYTQETLTARGAASLDARDEWDAGAEQYGSGLHPDDEVDGAAGFSAWVDRLIAEGDTALPPARAGSALITGGYSKISDT